MFKILCRRCVSETFLTTVLLDPAPMNVTLHGPIVTVAPFILTCLLALFTLAVVAVFAADTAISTSLQYLDLPISTQSVRLSRESSRRRAPRWRRGGAAGSLISAGKDHGVDEQRWRKLERMTVFTALLENSLSMGSQNAVFTDRVARKRSEKGTMSELKSLTCMVCLDCLQDNSDKIDDFETSGSASKALQLKRDVHVLSCKHAFHKYCLLRFLIQCSNRWADVRFFTVGTGKNELSVLLTRALFASSSVQMSSYLAPRCPMCNFEFLTIDDFLHLEKKLVSGGWELSEVYFR